MPDKIKKLISQNSPCKTIKLNEPMAPYSSFKIGGPADILLIPNSILELTKTIDFLKLQHIPFVIIGSGTNLLISDYGIREVVVLTTSLNRIQITNNEITAECGAQVKRLCETAQAHSLSGLEFIYGMPGTIGGAVWMNARCYGSEIADILKNVHYLDQKQNEVEYIFNAKDFSYKKSPFQKSLQPILKVTLRLKEDDKIKINQIMQENIEDREKKGHFKFPSAGSIFKNNRDFKIPTGKILDELGLRGFTIGDAQIAPYHGNIFINLGHAKAMDVLNLIKHATQLAFHKKQIHLEPEICFLGEWNKNELNFS